MAIYPIIYLLDSNNTTWQIGVNANGQLTSTAVGAQTPAAPTSIALNDLVIAQTWALGITPTGFLTLTFSGSGNSPSAANGLAIIAPTNIVWTIQVSNAQLQTTAVPAQAAISIYSSLETVMNLVRVYVNDWQAGATGTPGEGQISYDGAPQTLPALNSAIREVYRELRNVGDPTLLRDNVQVNLPANGATGPNIQTSLGLDGYFDGLTQQNSPVLPSDMMYPEDLWEQQTGTSLPFVKMYQPQGGLQSVLQQTVALGQWEWRGGKLRFVGSIAPITIRMRYYCALTQFLTISAAAFPTTYIPIPDCEEAVAAKTAFKIARALSGMTPPVTDLKDDATQAMFELRNAIARRGQTIQYHRVPYGQDTHGNFSASNSNTV